MDSADEYQEQYDQFFQQQYSQPEKTQKDFLRPLITPQQLQSNHDLYLMSIDVSCQVNASKTSSGQMTKSPHIIIYAVNDNQQAFRVKVSQFFPYFYALVPTGMEPTQENCQILRQGLIQRVKIMRKKSELSKQQKEKDSKNKFKQQQMPDAVLKIEIVSKVDLKYYVPQQIKSQSKFLKIYAKTPGIIPSLRKIFHDEEFIRGIALRRKTYQSNIPYPLRFMIDADLTGMGWFKIKKHQYLVCKESQKSTYCQLQIECTADAIQSIKAQNQFAKLAPLRVLSFDIECISSQGFPSADRQADKIIQIACVCKTTGQQSEDFRVLFALNGSAPIAGCKVKQVSSQVEMLLEFEKLIRSYDPDFLIGYNIINFDFKYIIERSQFLKMKNYGKFGRHSFKISKLKDGKFQSKVMGMRDTKQINIEGRIQLDLLIHMHREHKLSSYSLNNVSYYFLKQQKQDVHHSEINKLFLQSKQTRKRLGVYCIKDCFLPLRLMEKLCCLYNYSQMARVTGVPINYLLSKGQQIKVTSQLLRKAKEQDLIMPHQVLKQRNDDQANYEGAVVLDPISGYYTEPIATLDFASLYPSIMMAHNLCYTTLVNCNSNDVETLKKFGLIKRDEDYYVTPLGHVFSLKKQGLLPLILRQLIAARKKAKKQLAEATDPFMKAVLEGRQLALKISANSVYGYTGATVGHLPCLQISASVTSIGRDMINFTKDKVQKNFLGSQVIYGDTDSVMVRFKINKNAQKIDQIKQAMKFGREAAEIISKEFKSPIKLQFQKVYCPYLLITRKRYAGVYYTKPEKPDKIDKKGIESVRRDNCLLIRQMLEKVIDLVLWENNTNKALQYIKQCVSDLVQNKLDISKLVISKALTKKIGEESDDEQQKKQGAKTKEAPKKNTYKAKQAHSQLAEKMKKRDENVEIHVGDRISYVMIMGVKGSKNYQNAEDPIKVLQQDLPIDFDYYIQKQIKPPLQRLLKNTKIATNFDLLFSGDHTKNRYVPKIKENSFLGKFIKVQSTCVNCPIKSKTEDPFCEKCSQKYIDILLAKNDDISSLRRRQSDLWMQCNNCQGSVNMQIICQNMDCPIYYQRVKVQKDIKTKEKVFSRLQYFQPQESKQEY